MSVEPQAHLLRGVTLFDGCGASVRDATVVVQGDRILDVARGSCPRLTGARVHDLRGRFLVPGLIDVHAHAERPVDRAALLERGVTTIRIPGLSVPLRRDLPGPGVVAAGRIIDGPDSPLPAARRVADQSEIRAEVRRQAEEGLEWVKLYVALGPDLVRAALEEAHRCGLRVVGDLVATSWTAAARAGIDSLCHATPRHPALLRPAERERYREDLRRGAHPVCRFLELLRPDSGEVDEMVRALAAADVAVEPTLVGLEALLFTGDPEYHASLPPGGEQPPALDPRTVGELRRRAGSAWRRALELVGRLHQGGVRVVAGSDSPRPFVAPGISLHREVGLLAAAGLSAVEALGAATGEAAAALGLGAEVGAVRPGLRADLVLLERDPLADLENLGSVVWTMQAGVIRP